MHLTGTSHTGIGSPTAQVMMWDAVLHHHQTKKGSKHIQMNPLYNSYICYSIFTFGGNEHRAL